MTWCIELEWLISINEGIWETNFNKMMAQILIHFVLLSRQKEEIIYDQEAWACINQTLNQDIIYSHTWIQIAKIAQEIEAIDSQMSARIAWYWVNLCIPLYMEEAYLFSQQKSQANYKYESQPTPYTHPHDIAAAINTSWMETKL